MFYYNKIARGYDELYGQEQLKKIEIIKQNLEIYKNTKILDVGCGTGISSDFGCFVVGIDPSIRLLEKNNNLKVLGVAELLPFKKSLFDYVISVTSIHNFKNIKLSIEEMKRVGKENFVFSILKKSIKYRFIMDIILKNFKIEREMEDEQDSVLFCKTISFINSNY